MLLFFIFYEDGLFSLFVDLNMDPFIIIILFEPVVSLVMYLKMFFEGNTDPSTIHLWDFFAELSLKSLSFAIFLGRYFYIGQVFLEMRSYLVYSWLMLFIFK